MDNHDLKIKLNEFANGDMVTFSEIYEDLKVPVYTIIYRILYDHMMAEDLMQDIFVSLFKTPPPLHVENPRAYIFQMARNLAIDSKRKIRDNEPLSHRAESGDPLLDFQVSTRMDIEAALRSLKSEDREIVTLRLNGGLKFREIAEICKMPLGTVLWRYRKAIDRLRILLSGGE